MSNDSVRSAVGMVGGVLVLYSNCFRLLCVSSICQLTLYTCSHGNQKCCWYVFSHYVTIKNSRVRQRLWCPPCKTKRHISRTALVRRLDWNLTFSQRLERRNDRWKYFKVGCLLEAWANLDFWISKCWKSMKNSIGTRTWNVDKCQSGLSLDFWNSILDSWIF